jgi:CheY-like chemotaxis protein
MDGDVARPHILVCDDDAALRDLFREVLADEGYQVTVESSLCEHVDDVVALAPDLIVLDLIFNGHLSGIDFLRRLKTTPATQTIPVLTCTAAVVLDDETQRQVTAWECRSLLKPFDLDALIAAVRDCLGTTDVAV